MADIRINALATTAASTASDDFVAVDGSANGTRKLNAYSPTFGGNLTVSGTGTIGGNLTVSSGSLSLTSPTGSAATFTNTIDNNWSMKLIQSGGNELQFSGNITGNSGPSIRAVTSGGAAYAPLTVDGSTATIKILAVSALAIDGSKNATLAGNLTVSGTGNSSFAGNIRLPWSTPSLLSYYDATYSLGFVFDSANRKLVLRAQSADAPANGKGTIAFESGATPSEIARFAPSTGNLLLGTTTDSGNGKLQLATHTTSAGGIGFGTDISLYRDTNSTLNGTAPGGYALNRTGMNGVGLATVLNTASDAKTASDAVGISLSLQNSASAAKVYGQIYAEINSPTAASENGSLVLRTIGSGTVKSALTLDSSQNATFAGFVGIKDGMTAPSATSGTAKIYVDTADGDLKVIFGDGTIKTIATDT